MNKHLRAYFVMPHSKGTRWQCIVCGQSVPDGTQNKHAMEHVQLKKCPIFEGKGKK